jgi:uncharacterized membrane protein YkoI
MKRRITAGIAVVAVGAVGGVGVAGAAGGSHANARSAAAPASRLDDGKSLLSQSKISEQQAIAAAQTTAPGALNEVDLEHYQGRLVWNVDVGAKDVKVDAATGDVVTSSSDD